MNIEISDKLAALANFFIKKANDEGEALTQMKLIKLCYMAQGIHLALYHKPLFPDFFEAWRYGPVAPSLYQIFKESKSNQIVHPVEDSQNKTDTSIDLLDQTAINAAHQTWDSVGTWTAFQLSDWCHRKDSAWDKAIRANGYVNCPIPMRLIKEEFEALRAEDSD